MKHFLSMSPNGEFYSYPLPEPERFHDRFYLNELIDTYTGDYFDSLDMDLTSSEFYEDFTSLLVKASELGSFFDERAFSDYPSPEPGFLLYRVSCYESEDSVHNSYLILFHPDKQWFCLLSKQMFYHEGFKDEHTQYYFITNTDPETKGSNISSETDTLNKANQWMEKNKIRCLL